MFGMNVDKFQNYPSILIYFYAVIPTIAATYFVTWLFHGDKSIAGELWRRMYIRPIGK
jgi:hypothetical protein